MSPSEPSFQAFLEKNPQLCASGLAGPDLCQQLRLDYAGERLRLRESFADFTLCCDWLLDCTPMRRVSCVAPSSLELVDHVKRFSGVSVSNGALIAAVLYLRIPHHRPADSLEVRVGISLRSPTLCSATS